MTSAPGYTIAPATSDLFNVTLKQNVNESVARTLSPEEQNEIARYGEILEAIKYSYMWVMFAFGFPGNLMSLLVILRLRSFGSPAIYVATLAVVDNLAIVVKLMIVQFGLNKVALGLFGCKIMFFLGNHLVVFANWILIIMAIERFFAIWQPLHVNRMWTSRKAIISLAVVLVLTVALNAPIFVTVIVSDNGGIHRCIVDPQYAEMMGVWQWTQVTAYGFLPCTLLLTLNILIIVLIRRAQRLHRSMTFSKKNNTGGKNDNPKTSSSAGVQRQATIMLVVTSAVLVLTTTPICVYMLVQQWWWPERGTVEFARKQLIRFVLRAVCDANHSVNFYLYFVSARKFRSDFYKFVCWMCLSKDDRRGSEAATRHISVFRSTFKMKERPEGHLLVFQKKGVEEEEEGCSQNNMPLKMYAESTMNGTDTSTCNSLL